LVTVIISIHHTSRQHSVDTPDVFVYHVDMNKDQRIAVRLSVSVKAALERAAVDNKRATSSQVAVIVEAWLISQGYLKRSDP
jgi:hypothetical protein